MTAELTRQYRKGLVRIIAPSIPFDWVVPINKKTGTSIGSGFFIDDQGHFLTCAHVVNDANEVYVEIPFEGKRKFATSILGVCFDLDIALLKIENYKPKYYFNLGNSDQISISQTVFALGFPLGKDEMSLTQGVISGRESGVIQTDTALNPGNSGGPLIIDNNVIGINFSIRALARGVGYAVPISYYFLIEHELKKGNKHIVRRPTIGFEYTTLSNSHLELEKTPCGAGKGVYVTIVYPNSTSEKIGLKEGNIICSINNKSIDQHGMIESSYDNEEKVSLTEINSDIKNGAMVPIEFWNNQQLIKKNFPAEPYLYSIRKKYPRYENVEFEIFGGIIVMELAINHLPKFNVAHLIQFLEPRNRFKPKLIITKILPGSILEQNGIFNDGDLITSVNDKAVETLDQYRSAIVNPISDGKNKYIKIINHLRKPQVIKLNELLEQENKLIKNMEYKKSTLYQLLKNQTNNYTKKTIPFDEKTLLFDKKNIQRVTYNGKVPRMGLFQE